MLKKKIKTKRKNAIYNNNINIERNYSPKKIRVVKSSELPLINLKNVKRRKNYN